MFKAEKYQSSAFCQNNDWLEHTEHHMDREMVDEYVGVV